jgi:hypothetical protein
MPGVGSTAIAELLEAPGTGVVLGSSSHAVWLLVGDAVVVISSSDSTRLPNGVEVAAAASEDPFGSVQHGESVEIGGNRIMLVGLTVDVVRWWDPRPALPATTAEELGRLLQSLPSEVPDIDGSRLRDALHKMSGTGLLEAAGELLGWGTGLTPEGDDYLAGALAALAILGSAVGSEESAAMLAAIEQPLAELVVERTTTFSAALIDNALRGEVAAPAGDLLRALAGRGDVETSHAELCAVGHSSGPALAAGIVLGAHALIRTGR